MSTSGGFRHDIAGGQGNLIVASLKSPNFQTGIQGWQIAKDGSAEFNDVIVRGSESIDGVDLYYGGTPGPGTLIVSVASSGGTDKFGNVYRAGITTYAGNNFAQIESAVVGVSNTLNNGVGSLSAPSGFAGQMRLQSPLTGTGDAPFIANLSSANGGTSGTPSMNLNGSVSITDAAPGELVFIKQTGTAGHALTADLAATGGASQAAINAVSANSAFSAVEVTGTETGHGSVKITHLGYASGTDANASGISIDQRTAVGGTTGTQAMGIFITSTTDTNPGDAIKVRYNNLDWFVVKGQPAAGQGIIGVGIPVGHLPSGMVEIAQKDTTTPGLFMQAITGGTDMMQLRDPTGTIRFQVNNGGAAVMRGTAFIVENAIIGATSGDFGGAGSALTICHTTDPTTNPAAGHVILYVDGLGNLLARTSAGNVRTVAAV